VIWFASEKGKSDFKKVSEKTFEANQSGVSCLALNNIGTILAVTSAKVS